MPISSNVSNIGAFSTISSNHNIAPQLQKIVDGWAEYAYRTYTMRVPLAKIQSLFSVTRAGSNYVVSVRCERTTLDMFAFTSKRNALGGLTERSRVRRRGIKTAMIGRTGATVTGRVVKLSPVSRYEDKRTRTPAFFSKGKGMLFARNQQATWSGGKRLPIHRISTIPLAMFVASKRVERGYMLYKRLLAIGGTIVSRTVN